MLDFRSGRYKDALGALAAAVLAIACLVAAVYHLSVLKDLEHNGVRVAAIVVDFERGARGSKWAIYRYTTESGHEVTARDQFQQYIKRVKKDQPLYVIYHTKDATLVTADLGIWNWQAPAIFLFGFLFLWLLAILIWRHRGT